MVILHGVCMRLLSMILFFQTFFIAALYTVNLFCWIASTCKIRATFSTKGIFSKSKDRKFRVQSLRKNVNEASLRECSNEVIVLDHCNSKSDRLTLRSPHTVPSIEPLNDEEQLPCFLGFVHQRSLHIILYKRVTEISMFIDNEVMISLTHLLKILDPD